MRFNPPKNSDKYEWTRHAIFKLQEYGLSAQRIVRVIRNPQRVEKGIVKNTIAVMQPPSFKAKNGKKIWSQEIWAMYQIKNQKSEFQKLQITNQKLKIISAWRYPGVSPKNNPIPEEIIQEIASLE